MCTRRTLIPNFILMSLDKGHKGMKKVRFLRKKGGANAGQIDAYENAKADQLIADGFAEEYTGGSMPLPVNVPIVPFKAKVERERTGRMSPNSPNAEETTEEGE